MKTAETPPPKDKLMVYLDPSVNRALRLACVNRQLYLSAAIQEAIQLWLEESGDAR